MQFVRHLQSKMFYLQFKHLRVLLPSMSILQMKKTKPATATFDYDLTVMLPLILMESRFTHGVTANQIYTCILIPHHAMPQILFNYPHFEKARVQGCFRITLSNKHDILIYLSCRWIDYMIEI